MLSSSNSAMGYSSTLAASNGTSSASTISVAQPLENVVSVFLLTNASTSSSTIGLPGTHDGIENSLSLPPAAATWKPVSSKASETMPAP